MERIKLLILDVDGVLTDGGLWFSAQGEDLKRFHVQDGLGLQNLQRSGVIIAIISGRVSQAVTRRMAELKITHVYQGCADKYSVFIQLIRELGISPQETAYIGDDLPDLPVMQAVGLSIAVANACPEVKAIAMWQSILPGGMGAVREICDRLLKISSEIIL